MIQKNRGHTLIELLIAMSLSVVIVGALVPVNTLGLKAAAQQQKISLTVNQLRQSVKQFHTDVKSSGAVSCLFDRNNIRDLVFAQPTTGNNQLQHPWVSGNQNGTWYSSAPFFDNTNINSDNDAIHLMFADLVDPLNSNNLNSGSNRVFYLTNCVIAEITRGNDATLHDSADSRVYPLQSIIYYAREVDDQLILYRQYLSKSGNPRNEPLIDNLKQLKIAYAEAVNDDTLAFKNASSVSDWSQVIAIYIEIQVQIKNLSFSISKLIDLSNLNV